MVPEGFMAPPALTIVLIDKSLVLDNTDDADEDIFEVDDCGEDATEDKTEETEAADEILLDTELAIEALVDGVVSLTPPPQADNIRAHTQLQMLLV